MMAFFRKAFDAGVSVFGLNSVLEMTTSSGVDKPPLTDPESAGAGPGE
jgi:hypothetical protein